MLPETLYASHPFCAIHPKAKAQIPPVSCKTSVVILSTAIRREASAPLTGWPYGIQGSKGGMGMDNPTIILPFGNRPRTSPRSAPSSVHPMMDEPTHPNTPDAGPAHHVIPNRQWPAPSGLHPLALIALTWLCAVVLDLLLHRLHLRGQLAPHLQGGTGQLSNLLKWLPVGMLAGLIPLLQKPCPIYHHWMRQPAMLLIWLLSGLLISPLLGLPGIVTGFAAGILLVLPFVKVRHEGLASRQAILRHRSDSTPSRHLPLDARRRSLVTIGLALTFSIAACLTEWAVAPRTLALLPDSNLAVTEVPGSFVTGSAGTPILPPEAPADLAPVMLFLMGTGVCLAFLLRRPTTGTRRTAAASAVILWVLLGFLVAYIRSGGPSTLQYGLPAWAATFGYLAQGLFIASPAYVCTISGNLLIVLTGLLTGWSCRGLLPWLSGHRRIRDGTFRHADNVVPLRRRLH